MTTMRTSFAFIVAVSAALAAGSASAQNAEGAKVITECAGHPNALGVARVVEIDTTGGPGFGFEHFKAYDFLRDKEVVLTFDDGPWPTTTPKVLDALAAECVRASFFMLGQHAQATPQLARRVLAAGHTVAHHTYAHPLLDKMSTDAAEAEINRGFSAVDYAVFSQRRSDPATPFFRFPGFASTPALIERLQRRGIVVFGADFWASDWVTMTPERQFDLIMARTEQFGRGIVLFHDTREQTAAMLPRYLRELKKRGYKIVHIVPAGSRGSLR